MSNGEIAYTRKPGFTWGFEIAKRLRLASFRQLLDGAGYRNTQKLIPTCPQEPFTNVLDRMEACSEGWLVVQDDTMPEGVQLIWWERR